MKNKCRLSYICSESCVFRDEEITGVTDINGYNDFTMYKECTLKRDDTCTACDSKDLDIIGKEVFCKNCGNITLLENLRSEYA